MQDHLSDNAGDNAPDIPERLADEALNLTIFGFPLLADNVFFIHFDFKYYKKRLTPEPLGRLTSLNRI